MLYLYPGRDMLPVPYLFNSLKSLQRNFRKGKKYSKRVPYSNKISIQKHKNQSA